MAEHVMMRYGDIAPTIPAPKAVIVCAQMEVMIGLVNTMQSFSIVVW